MCCADGTIPTTPMSKILWNSKTVFQRAQNIFILTSNSQLALQGLPYTSVCLCFWDRVFGIQGWLPTFYVVEDDLGLVIFLLPRAGIPGVHHDALFHQPSSFKRKQIKFLKIPWLCHTCIYFVYLPPLPTITFSYSLSILLGAPSQ